MKNEKLYGIILGLIIDFLNLLLNEDLINYLINNKNFSNTLINKFFTINNLFFLIFVIIIVVFYKKLNEDNKKHNNGLFFINTNRKIGQKQNIGYFLDEKYGIKWEISYSNDLSSISVDNPRCYKCDTFLLECRKILFIYLWKCLKCGNNIWTFKHPEEIKERVIKLFLSEKITS